MNRVNTPLNHDRSYSNLLRAQLLAEQTSLQIRRVETPEECLRRVLVEQMRQEGAR